MPGYIIHLAAARLALDKLGFNNYKLCQSVYLGSIIPDAMARENKKKSHFWDEESLKLLKRVPNVERFKKQYFDSMNNPMVAAYYAHLVMDKHFVDVYWDKHFEFYNADMKSEEGYNEVSLVRIKDTGELLDRTRFLSDEYYYGDYTRLLEYIIWKYRLKELFWDKESDVIYDIGAYDSYFDRLIDDKASFCIKELSPEALREPCIKMLSNVYKIAFKDNNYMDYSVDKPVLKVFILDEFEKMIEETADFLKNILRMYEELET